MLSIMKIAVMISLACALLSGTAGAQEGFSPTLPFGTQGMERTQAPVNNPQINPYQNQYSHSPNGWGYGSNSYNYYYGPYGVYSNGGVAPYAQTGSAQYKSDHHDGSLPGYNKPLEQRTLPGY